MRKRKDKKINIWVTQEQIDAVDARMKLAGMNNRSAYMMQMALHGFILKTDLSDLKEILRLIQINSNNINQIARKANETGNIYQAEIKEVRREHQMIIELLRKFLDKYNAVW